MRLIYYLFIWDQNFETWNPASHPKYQKTQIVA